MVWFYHKKGYGALEEAIKSFQSHYGLILSLTLLTSYSLAGRAFNPTMVWFYRSWFGVCAPEMASFQSHYGLILSGNQGVLGQEKESPFNPTMVWFYLNKSTVQRAGSSTVPFNPTMVWFYHAKPDAYLKFVEEKLSIPLWSDFIVSPVLLSLHTFRPFNPTMVWFYLFVLFQFLFRFLFPFNPTMVWFYLKRIL